MLQLCVTTTVVDERRSPLYTRRFNLAEDNRVIAAVVDLHATALDHSKDIVENRVSVRGHCETDTLEAVYVDDREAPCDLFLFGRKNVDRKAFRRRQCWIDRC